MHRLKLIVGIMSSLIVICLGLVAYGMVKNVRETAIPAKSAEITLKKGASIEHISQFNDYIIMHVKTKKGEKLVFVNPEDSSVSHSIPIKYK